MKTLSSSSASLTSRFESFSPRDELDASTLISRARWMFDLQQATGCLQIEAARAWWLENVHLPTVERTVV